MLCATRWTVVVGASLAAATAAMLCLAGCQGSGLVDRMEKLAHLRSQRLLENAERRKQAKPEWPPFSQDEVLAVLGQKPDLDMTVAEWRNMFQDSAAPRNDLFVQPIVSACQQAVRERHLSNANLQDLLAGFRIWVYHWNMPRKQNIHTYWPTHTQGPFWVSDYYLFDAKGLLLPVGSGWLRRGMPAANQGVAGDGQL